MESFYGGRPGASFIITKSFNSIDDMKAAFRKGAAYTDVYYDEYVIITVPDTAGADRKKQNGNVYRRGYDYTNEMGGAEFVGNISGPAGPVTKIDITHFNDSNFDQNVEVKNFAITNQDDLVPGAQKINGSDDWTYNDTIAWKYYYFNDAEQEQSIMKIGFKIPFPVIDLEVQLVNPNAPATATRVDDKSHPFFSQWKFEIPQAKKGDSIKKISIISGKQNADINYETYDSVATVQQAKKQDDYDTDRLILIFTKVSYDSEGNEDVETDYYLGDYQIVQNIDITPQGYMRFTLPDGSTVSSQSRVIPRIIGVDLNETGQITFKWKDTNGTETEMKSDTEIQWIDDIDYTKDGNLKITWNTIEKDNNGEEKKDENNNLIKNTKILQAPFSSITNIVIIDGVLYQTYLGIEKEIENFEQDQQATNGETLITYQDSMYYHDIANGMWYKKIADLSFLIKEMLINFKVLNPDDPLPGTLYKDNQRYIGMTLKVSTSRPCYWTLEGSFLPKSPWPAYLFDNKKKYFANRTSITSKDKILLQNIVTITNSLQHIYNLYLATGGQRFEGDNLTNLSSEDQATALTTMMTHINEHFPFLSARFYQLNDGKIRVWIAQSGINGSDNMSYFEAKAETAGEFFSDSLGVVFNFDGAFPDPQE